MKQGAGNIVPPNLLPERSHDFVSAWMEFLLAVDWTESWIQAILVMHLGLAAVAIFCRRNMTIQLVIFVTAVAIVALGEQLNALGAEFWEEFSRQPYFDKHGAFYSTVVAFPLILVMCGILINCCVRTTLDMIILKRRQLKHQAQQKQRLEQTGANDMQSKAG
jgi:hypothetical protein